MRSRAFVIMPFHPVFDDLYQLSIRPGLRAAGYDAERFDDRPRQQPVLEEISRQIQRADLVVAVLTGRNPHVFFELGLTYASGKAYLLIAEQDSEIPCFLDGAPRFVGMRPTAAQCQRLAESIRPPRLKMADGEAGNTSQSH